ncbi:MAG: flagellar basal-body rod protein FlgB [Candidatus Handelsmanbacteria bacterium RIFCSPLOWO2_12_FULL_64_10]|uniref:Flagellar basal body rod protein FlgB n=1 Tax=Handelsmanbacteria sp. (strain RIFCSPLOWO2_12_FULL_64_10) TaxID=1817868 RepID=A0A1F6D681_HANXR|nr:MAG: flagellar basal-body rod protein FlgB [Candidatus Handelsmanbacteria bacterium RIFCSPLOWO2_12_FULL_64_10]
MVIRNLIIDKTRIPLLTRALDVTSLRHRALTNNIANVNTINYRRKEVDFEGYLRSFVVRGAVTGVRTDARHIPIGEPDPSAPPRIYEPKRSPNTTGQNDVDIDQEMAHLAENHLLYNASVKLITGSFSSLRKSIVGTPDVR